MRLKDKVAIITGSAAGIGFIIAEEFAKQGAKVAICDIANVEKASGDLKTKYPNADILSYPVNVTSTEDIEKMVKDVVEKWGRIDILVNNAGIMAHTSLLETTDESFERVIAINLTGVFKCSRAVVAVMRDTGGSIINTSSMVGTFGGINQCPYSASKAGVNGLTKSFAKELGKYNIRVNAIAPGVINTEMLTKNTTQQMLEGLKKITPLGRMGEAQELMGLYVYFASDDSSFTTGTIVHVDGAITG